MQLVYFWIEKYGVLKEQEINFNSGFQFKMEEVEDINSRKKYVLKRERDKEKKIPKNFFGKRIENISCIIGENGSGKTTLIKAIIKQKHYKKSNGAPKYISIFEENNILYKYENIDGEFDTKELNIKKLNENIFHEEIKYIYFNNDIMNEVISGISNVFNISLGKELRETAIRSLENRTESIGGDDIIRELRRENNKKIVDFVFKSLDIIKKIPCSNIQEKLSELNKIGEIEVYLVQNIYENEESRIFKKIFGKIKNLKKVENQFKNNFIENSWKYISSCLEDDIKEKKLNEKEILSIFDEIEKEEEIEIWFDCFFEKLEIKIKEYDKKYERKYDENPMFYKSLASERIVISFFKYFINLFFKENNQVEFRGNSFIFNYNENEEIYEQLNKYYLRNDIFSYNLTKGFSSGEVAYLKLVIEINKLYSAIKSNGEPKDIIFFLEELEIFMHPEWQRRSIELLIKLKETIPWMKKVNVQFILTSHTPFLIGDLPEKNISLFKGEGENKKLVVNEVKTFGGNIFNLLKDTFLMESCFGEISKNKIEKVIKLLTKKKNGDYKKVTKKEIKEIEFVIDSVGEVLIKNGLEKMYDEYKKKKNEDLGNEEKLKKIKEYINKLGMSHEYTINKLKSDIK